MCEETKKEIVQIRQKCKNRILVLAGLSFFCVPLFILVFLNFTKPIDNITERQAATLMGFQIGVLSAFFCILVYFIIYYILVINKDELARKLYVKETDERNIKIKEKTGFRLHQVYTIVLILSAVISGYFSFIAFFVQVGVIYVQNIIQFGFKLYWEKKI